MPDGEVLHARHVLDYPYSRSVGPIIGAFLTGLRDGKILGATGSGGSVIVPPTEYDPITGEDVGELVEVGPGGVVETWSWVSNPMPKHPLDHPFAFALIRLDGASTSMLHVVDAGTSDALAAGARVVPRWKSEPERVGHVLDIEAFVPDTGAA
jgi:uncharacterized OB-fold protein